MAGYVLAVLGTFLLVRNVVRRTVLREQARLAAASAALLVAANPNLLYLQSTALNEALYLALFIWSVYWLEAFTSAIRGRTVDARLEAARAIECCALAVSGAMFLRYDGWFLAAALAAVVLLVVLRHGSALIGSEAASTRLRRALLKSVLLTALVPLLWFAYNYREFGDPLEFATGPYSARGIMERTTKPGDSAHPGHSDPWVAALYFQKCAKLNLGEGRWGGLLLAMGVAGSVVALLARAWPWLLLWLPLPFYTLSIAYGGVPIFLPVWWPFSYYNARYGINLLPAAAVFVGLLVAFLSSFSSSRRWRHSVTALVLGVAGVAYASVWRAQPLDYREIVNNSRDRIAYEKQLAAVLQRLPSSSRLLMYTGDSVDALRRAGIPLRRVINETNHPHWEQALSAPADHVDFVIAPEGGPVADAAPRHASVLEPVATVDSPGKPRTVIYRVKRSTGG